MKKIALLQASTAVFCFFALAQNGRVVLVESFVETGCSACAQYDSAFQAVTRAHADKVAVISFHCYYKLDPFYTYCKACDKRYADYKLEGYPSAMVNGKMPVPNSTTAHLSFVNAGRINTLYNQPPLFRFDVQSTPTGQDGVHSAAIEVTATALEENSSEDLRLYVVITENNINYEQRYGSKAVNGLNEFNHIVRAMLPDPEGTAIGAQTKGKVSKVKVTFTNDDSEINYKEVRIVTFIQDNVTKEVLGASVTKEHPFQ